MGAIESQMDMILSENEAFNSNYVFIVIELLIKDSVWESPNNLAYCKTIDSYS